MKKLPYRTQTTMGDTFDIDFPLHSDTQNAIRVQQVVSALLRVIDSEIAIAGEMSNGDVLQAVAMTMAIRGRMIHASSETVEELSMQLLQTALDAAVLAERKTSGVGHA